MDIQQYLTRINGFLAKEISYENLTMLQNQHLEHVPFENLDVIRRVPIYLNPELIYEKVVNHNRGGFCYELNGLFCSLLNELGYNAHLVAATVLKKTGEWAKPDSHAAILVKLDEPYLIDVGFGAATPRLPIPLNGSKRTDVHAAYYIQKHEEQLFDLAMHNQFEERTLYRFSADKKELDDFYEGCVFNQVAKESIFTHTDIITLMTKTGRITLTDQTVTVIENGIQKKEELSTGEKVRFLQDSFKIWL